MWVITRGINEYYQDGNYFVAVYTHKSTFQELKTLLNISDSSIKKLMLGGGRESLEGEWFYLTQIESGERYG